MTWLLALAFATEPAPPDAAADPATEALDAYLARRLAVDERAVSTAYGRGYDGSGRFWFVTEGERTVSARRLAEALGDEEGVRRLTRRRTTAAALGLSSLGVGIGSGYYATRSAETLIAAEPDGLQTGVLVGSLTVAVAGLVGGTVLLARLPRTNHPSALYTEDEARDRVQQANATLRDELLGPE